MCSLTFALLVENKLTIWPCVSYTVSSSIQTSNLMDRFLTIYPLFSKKYPVGSWTVGQSRQGGISAALRLDSWQFAVSGRRSAVSGRQELELWNPGTLEPWNFGTLEPWNNIKST